MRRVTFALVVGVLSIGAHAAGASTCLDVYTYMALSRATNPIRVVQGNGPLVDLACQAWQAAINQAHWDPYWILFVTDDTRVPNVVYESVIPATSDCLRHSTATGDRIDWFEIRTHGYGSWCQSDTPEKCAVGAVSYYDVIVHEVGHAVGMESCDNVCACDYWNNLPADQQVDQFPTMIGSWYSCSCMSCGYYAPYVLCHTLAEADLEAAARLYPWYVVPVSEPVSRVLYRDGSIHVVVDNESTWCGASIVIMGGAAATDVPRQLDGKYEIESNGTVCAAVVRWPWAGRPGVVWVRRNGSTEVWGPYTVVGEEEYEGELGIRVLPNPANASVSIVVAGGAMERAAVVIYDIRGRAVCSVYEGAVSAKGAVVQWDGRSEDGKCVASGSYVAVLSVGGRIWREVFSIVK